VKDFKVLKTTQSGYEGYLKDQYTLLAETRERMMATSMTATWRYAFQPLDYDAAFTAVRGALVDGVFGPPKGGVYSPSVQYTLYQMALLALERVPQVRGEGVGPAAGKGSCFTLTCVFAAGLAVVLQHGMCCGVCRRRFAAHTSSTLCSLQPMTCLELLHSCVWALAAGFQWTCLWCATPGRPCCDCPTLANVGP
jgi:hypothetical protein